MTERTYTLDELCNLTGLPKRTIRYYIQMGLVDRPEGEKRTAFYLTKHLESLLRVKRLSAQGLSLEKIRQGGDGIPQEVSKPQHPGDVSYCSHIYLADGIELVVDANASSMDQHQMRRFIKGALEILQAFKAGQEETEKQERKD